MYNTYEEPMYCSIGYFRVYLAPLFKNESSYKSEFDLHENEAVGRTNFHMNGFACRLLLTSGKRQLLVC